MKSGGFVREGEVETMMAVPKRPAWLKFRFQPGEDVQATEAILKRWSLHTVCWEACCPNRGECYRRQTATFLILGEYCTRHCGFCGVKKGIPRPVDPGEPARIAGAVRELGLKHVVLTSVTRDDLRDGGAQFFAATIQAVRNVAPEARVEVLIPDLGGSREALACVLEAFSAILGHNLETVPRLYKEVRAEADYQRSLGILEAAKSLRPGILSKSGLMLGLGETKEEVLEVMDDLRQVQCDFLTLGQYLPPRTGHFPVKKYYSPREFQYFFREGTKKGFRWIESGPLVRSSYHADRPWKKGALPTSGC